MGDRDQTSAGWAPDRRGSFAAAGLSGFIAFAAVAAILLFGGNPAEAEPPLPDADPVNPEATTEARALLRKICAISGRFTLSGQQNFPEDLARSSERVQQFTGLFPAIFGQDFGFSDFGDRRARMIAEVVRQHRAGGVIALTWHAPSPTIAQPANYEESVPSKLTDAEWADLLTAGTSIYTRWAEQVDEIAAWLQQLAAAQVPVLFRPYHEINARWFWWNGRAGGRGSPALYRQLFERFVHVHRLNNLVWVWNVNAPSAYAGPIERYYPGHDRVDVLTMDNYCTFRRSFYDRMLVLAGRKPIALAEVGPVPPIEVLVKQPRWAYFMIWRGFEETNSPDRLRAIFPNVLSRDDTRLAALAPA
ncbi:MAG: glycosyl hydrolase, partial [Terracidiphilus sp.]